MSELDEIRRQIGSGHYNAEMLLKQTQRIAIEQEAELTQLRTERERLRRAITESLYAIDNYDGEPVGAIASILDDAIYDAALTQRESRGQQLWPPVVDSANDSREGGEE